MRGRVGRFLFAVFALGGVLGCGRASNGPSTFTPEVDAAPEPDAAPVIADSGGADAAVVVKRTIVRRNPLGRMDVPGNLFADGDFEFSGPRDQMPWIVAANGEQQALAFATGGSCSSGVRCARIIRPQILIGVVASPKTEAFRVRLWTRVPGGACDDLSVSLIDLADADILRAFDGEAVSDGSDGGAAVCQFEALVSAAPGRQLYLTVDTSEARFDRTASVLVDDAVALPVSDPFPVDARGYVRPRQDVAPSRRIELRPGSEEQERMRALFALLRERSAPRAPAVRAQGSPTSGP